MKFSPAQSLSRPKLAYVAALFIVVAAMPCGFEFGQPSGEIPDGSTPDPATAGVVGHSRPQAGKEKPATLTVRPPRGTAAVAESTGRLPERASELPSTATAPPTALTTPDSATKVHLVDTLGKLPLSFEPNQGTTDPQVKFLSRGRGYTLFLTADEATLAVKEPSDRSVVRLKLTGANANSKVVGVDELPGRSNYFIEGDPKMWRTSVPHFAKVRYEQIYPGIDLIYYGSQRQLEYDFVVAPGADPRAIRFEIVGAGLVPAQAGRPQGAPLRIDANGDLVIATEGGEVGFREPVVYQPVAALYER